MGYNLKIPGYMTEQELLIIEQLAKNVPVEGRIVELGSLFGRSAVCWAESADPSVEIICIDIFYEKTIPHHNHSIEICNKLNFPLSGVEYNSKKLFEENTKQYPNIKMIRGFSPTEIVYDGKEIDFFFLDALHKNPSDWENILYFLPYIKEGGFIGGHDYRENFPDVIKNVKKLEEISLTEAITYKSESIWYMKVNSTLKNNLSALK